ncbi:DMT family transporter [Janthinobacterium sp. P210005]|uniref:DMT family transporter n=1 Tax=Janthinobacterium sp. P210005 TaxID=3112938 RepID=UPI002E258EF5|nr:DMT family transporter [Janthinobacterium sp. P210005]
MLQKNKTRLGMLAGIAAGALWGLVFLAPALLPAFQPLELSVGRYLAYGLIAAVLVAPSWRRLLRSLGWREWRGLIWLSLTGNIIYYVLLASAVQMGGVAMTSMVIGLLPLVVTVVGSRDHDAVPLRKLLPSLLLSGAGLLCISWQSLAHPGHASLLGLLCALAALLSWTVYAVGNSRWLGRLRAVSAQEWNLLTGVVTGAAALLLAIPVALAAPAAHGGTAWLQFAGLVTGVALLCSVVGNGLWNYASRVLPLTLMGQMIVFEFLFALLYGYAWERRWPTAAESAATALLLAGVLACAVAHRPQRAASAATARAA